MILCTASHRCPLRVIPLAPHHRLPCCLRVILHTGWLSVDALECGCPTRQGNPAQWVALGYRKATSSPGGKGNAYDPSPPAECHRLPPGPEVILHEAVCNATCTTVCPPQGVILYMRLGVLEGTAQGHRVPPFAPAEGDPAPGLDQLTRLMPWPLPALSEPAALSSDLVC